MPNQNGGTTEYTNIINGIQGIDSKINEQQILLENEFGKKILDSDVRALNTHTRSLITAGVLLGGVATVRTAGITGDLLAAQATIAARQLALQEGMLVVGRATATTATSAASTVARSAPLIARGGIGGLAAGGSGLFAVVGRLVGLWGNVAIVLYQLWELLSSICSFQAEVGEKVAFLETELAAEQAKTRRLQQHVTTLEAKVNQLPEKVAQQIERPGGVLNSISNTSVEIKNTVGEVKNTVGEVKNTVGEVKNTLGEKFGKLFKWLPLAEIFSVLAFITSLHNAMMLSSNLVQTLGSVIDVALDVLHLKGPEGESFDISSILGQKASDLMKSILGESTWTNLQNTWKKTNRVYQATMNMANSMQSLIDSARNIMEIGAENTGKIGNALKRAGVVFDSAYDWMPENINAATNKQIAFKRVFNTVNELDDTASSVESVLSEIQSIQQVQTEISEARQEWKKSVDELKATKLSEETTAKFHSQSIPATKADLVKPSEEQ